MQPGQTSIDPDTFKSTFGSRIDTLAVTLQAHEDGDPKAEFTIRRLAHTVGSPASACGMDELFEAALGVQRALKDRLADATHALIKALRDHASGKPMLYSRILIVGGIPATNASLAESLRSPSRHVVIVETAADALKAMQSERAACIILSVVLPDLDSRVFSLKLRENPLTASIPILFVGARINDQIKEQSELHPADGYCENPSGIEDIVEWVQLRLRRTPEPLRASRRDVLTGLLNQAALREAFAAAQAERRQNNDPLTLACIAVDNERHILNAVAENAREEILQTLGMTLSASLRTYDSVSRWGTYEFVVLLPGEDAFGGACAMEKVLEQLRTECISLLNPVQREISLSIGVTQIEAHTECEEAISQAEHLVYQATSMGGNRVVSAQSIRHSTRIHRVLILSADKLTCDVLTNMLDRNSIPSAAYSTLEEALSADLDSQRFHLVIIDQNFPPSGGFGVLQQLRDDPKNHRLPIVMLISENIEANVTKALDMGANDYLVRPFSPNHFVGRIRRLLSRRPSEPKDEELHKLLIIDSNTKSLVLAATVLHQHGYKVYLAHSVDMAIKRYDEIAPHVVISDVSFSESETLRLAEELSRRKHGSEIPFVLLTAPFQSAKLILPPPAHVVGLITKPLDPIGLPGQVEAYLHISGSSTRSEGSLEHLNREIQGIMRPRT